MLNHEKISRSAYSCSMEIHGAVIRAGEAHRCQSACSRKVLREGSAGGGCQLRQRCRVGARRGCSGRCKLVDLLLHLSRCGSRVALESFSTQLGRLLVRQTG